MKKCNGCGRELPAEAFSKDKSRKDGLQSRCKACQAEKGKAWYEANKERKAAADKAKYDRIKSSVGYDEWRSRKADKDRGRYARIKDLPEHKGRLKEYRAKNREWRERNKDRNAANKKAWYARKRAEFLAANPGYVPKFGFNPDKPGAFYLLRIESMAGDYIGYGISNRIKRRMAKHRCTLKDIGARIVEEHFIPFDRGYDAVAVEQLMDEHAAGRLHLDAEGFKTESFPGGVAEFEKWKADMGWICEQ